MNKIHLNRPRQGKGFKASTVRSLIFLFLAVLLLVTLYIAQVASNTVSTKQSPIDIDSSKQHLRSISRKNSDQLSSKVRRFEDFRRIAVALARLSPSETLQRLEQDDPFGTRAFEQRLEETETEKGRILTLDEVRELFPCPSDDRISLPDRRNRTQAQAYRNDASHTFLFFQHLRKAGGTHFCSLAERNLPKQAIPRYYCMPDYHWKHEDGRDASCAGCLTQWTNEEIVEHMGPHRIAGNEWDKFDSTRHFDLPAVFATSFRRPLDRALSQFRFECVEDRGCHEKDVGVWWKKRRDLINVYTWTFGIMNRIGRISFDKEYADDRASVMESAIDTVARFHLVLAMEWLAYAKVPIQEILGFKDTSAVTQRVRPHITQAKRHDNQEHNELGAAGIAKASWSAKEYLTKEQYKEMSESLAMDEVLTDAARRMFLERLVCPDLVA